MNPRRIAATEVHVTALGFGAAQIGNLDRAVTDEEAAATLAAAAHAGIGYVDTAPYYGHGLSETRVGTYLPAALTLSTKVGRVLDPVPDGEPVPFHGFVETPRVHPVFDFSAAGIRRSLDESAERLRGRRIAIAFVHDMGALVQGDDHPRSFRQVLDEALPVLVAAKAAGQIGAIGVGVNEVQVCFELLAWGAPLDAILLAGRYTLLEQRSLPLLDLCAARNISVIAAAPFNSGALAGGDTYNYAAIPEKVAAKVSALAAACDRHAVPLPAAALRFPLAHPAVASVLVGLRSPEQVRAAASWFAADIPGALWTDLKAAGLLDPLAPT